MMLENPSVAASHEFSQDDQRIAYFLRAGSCRWKVGFPHVHNDVYNQIGCLRHK